MLRFTCLWLISCSFSSTHSSCHYLFRRKAIGKCRRVIYSIGILYVFRLQLGDVSAARDATDISFARRKNSESKLKELRWAFLGRMVRKYAKSFRTCRRRFWKSTRTWIWRLYWSKETIESLERWQRGHCENTKYHWVMLWSRISIEYSSKTTLPCTLYTLNKSLEFELCRLFHGRQESTLKRRNKNYGHQCL